MGRSSRCGACEGRSVQGRTAGARRPAVGEPGGETRHGRDGEARRARAGLSQRGAIPVACASRPPTWHIIARRTDSLPRAPAIPSPQHADSSSTRAQRMRICTSAVCAVLPVRGPRERVQSPDTRNCLLHVAELELLRGPVVSAPGEPTGVLQLFCQRASPHQLSPPGASVDG
jgi:hypothetical protein